MNPRIRWSLSTMMFLQYMTLGSWYPFLSPRLESLGFTGIQIGIVYSLLPIGCMIAPFAGGQLADRHMRTEKLLALLHLFGGLILCVMALISSYHEMLLFMLLWALAFAPTFALTNSITFYHLTDAENTFGVIRVFGTLGWIAAGLILTAIRKIWPETQGLPYLGGTDCLWIGGGVSLALGLFCLTLPATPPAKNVGNSWAFLSAWKLLRDPSFAFLIGISLVVSTEIMFYYVLTAPFLQSIGIKSENIPAVMTIAQVAEIGAMLSLPWLLRHWGMRKTLALGIIAWPIRYALFAYGYPRWLVIAALTLHGLCFVCFSVASFIYVDAVAPPDIRASAQAFLTFITTGVGMYFGSLFAGWITTYFSVNVGNMQVTDYTRVFMVPCLITIACAITFFLTFKDGHAHSSRAKIQS
jgi:nucleoside transporter